MVEREGFSPGTKVEAWDDKNISDISNPSSSDETLKDDQKEHKILEACKRRDVEELQLLAGSPGGFMNDEVRQEACELRSGPYLHLVSSFSILSSAPVKAS